MQNCFLSLLAFSQVTPGEAQLELSTKSRQDHEAAATSCFCVFTAANFVTEMTNSIAKLNYSTVNWMKSIAKPVFFLFIAIATM